MKTSLSLGLLAAFAFSVLAPVEASARSYDDHRRYDDYRYDYRYDKKYRDYESSKRTRKDVQKELARRGYYRGPIDGDLGRYSRAAIHAYQVDRRLPVSGRIDRPLLRSLRLL